MTFTLLDPNHHALAINVRRPQMNSLTDAHASAIHGAENDMVRKGRSGLQQLQDLFRTKNHRQTMILLGSRDQLDGPLPFQGDTVEKPQSAHRYRAGTNGCIPFLS